MPPCSAVDGGAHRGDDLAFAGHVAHQRADLDGGDGQALQADRIAAAHHPLHGGRGGDRGDQQPRAGQRQPQAAASLGAGEGNVLSGGVANHEGVRGWSV